MSKTTETSNENVLEGELKTGPLSATELRSSIFAKQSKPVRKPFTFNGIQVEFLQPAIGSMFNQESSDEDAGVKKSFIIQTMIRNTVAPGTTDRIFEDTDYDSIMEMPMTGEIQQVTAIIQELMNINVDDKVKN